MTERDTTVERLLARIQAMSAELQHLRLQTHTLNTLNIPPTSDVTDASTQTDLALHPINSVTASPQQTELALPGVHGIALATPMARDISRTKAAAEDAMRGSSIGFPHEAPMPMPPPALAWGEPMPTSALDELHGKLQAVLSNATPLSQAVSNSATPGTTAPLATARESGATPRRPVDAGDCALTSTRTR